MRRTDERGEREVVGDYDWRAIFYDPAGELYRTMNPSSASGYYRPQAQSAYWRNQLAPGALAAYQSGRISAGQALQQQLRAQQLANIQAMQQSAAAQGLAPITLPPMPTSPSYATPPTMPPTAPDGTSASAPPPFDPFNPYATDPTNPNQGSTTTMGVFDILGAIARNVFVKPTVPRQPGPLDPHHGVVVKFSPKNGRAFTAVKVNRNARFKPKKTLATARTVAARGQQVGARAITALQKLSGTKVHGAVFAAPKKPIGRRPPKMSVAATKTLARKVIASSAKLSKTANAYAGKLSAFDARLRSGQQKAQAATKLHGSVDVLGDIFRDGTFEDIVGAQYGEAFFEEIVGEYIDDNGNLQPGNDPNGPGYGSVGDPSGGGGSVAPSTSPPDPNNPGYLMDGTPDPNYGGGSAGASGVAGPPDYGAGAPPTPDSIAPQPYVDYVPDPGVQNDTTFYDAPTDDDLPLGAVIFDGSHLPPQESLGSYSSFWGTVPGLGEPKGGAYSGYIVHSSGWWLKLQGPGGGYSGGKNYDKVSDPSAAMQSENARNNWGPLVGAVTLPDGSPSWTRGLRFSPSGPNGPRWFWYWDQAPDWAKQPILLARMNDAIVQYQSAVNAGLQDYLSAQLQDQLDAADAAKAAKAQAAVDANVAQQNELLQAQQAAYDEQQYEQQQAQQAALQQAQQQYMIAHPDQFFDPNAAPPPGYDQGGGYYDPNAPQGYDQGGSGSGDVEQLDDGSAIDWGDGSSGNGSDGLS